MNMRTQEGIVTLNKMYNQLQTLYGLSCDLKNAKALTEDEFEEYFKDVYGVYPIKGEQKQQIKFRASAMATNYLQAHPIHESQEVVKNDRADSTITLELIPSVELVRLFRSYGREIRIIEPEWLTNKILQRRTGNEKR